jgi:amidase
LPVWVPLGLLSIGDVHGSMGDGELSGFGIEVAADVTVAIQLQKSQHLRHPWIETQDRLIAVSSARDFADARREVTQSVVNVVERQLGLSTAEALMLISAVGDLRIGQAYGGMDMTLRLEMPRKLRLHPEG